MEKMNKFQLVKATVLLLLLLVIPFVSSSMRPSYLYFLLNILILSLGIEAGFIAAISNPRDEKKIVASAAITVNKLKKCPSVPSLFFIGSYETEEEETKSEYEQEEEEEGVMEAELGDKLSEAEKRRSER
ncbi:hypothetical protein KFK09_012037 [Dendrobium nobile]|uniref:Uncharacterized protein n=1 Tax=Dendrobium nobile TaxID=94219 RepID=A0A8T3BGQ8_DENNO|nr:hypothetical protein KFK09_012037 [Dendrobium nobile]